jgi:hypothetical protein
MAKTKVVKPATSTMPQRGWIGLRMVSSGLTAAAADVSRNTSLGLPAWKGGGEPSGTLLLSNPRLAFASGTRTGNPRSERRHFHSVGKVRVDREPTDRTSTAGEQNRRGFPTRVAGTVVGVRMPEPSGPVEDTVG